MSGNAGSSPPPTWRNLAEMSRRGEEQALRFAEQMNVMSGTLLMLSFGLLCAALVIGKGEVILASFVGVGGAMFANLRCTTLVAIAEVRGVRALLYDMMADARGEGE